MRLTLQLLLVFIALIFLKGPVVAQVLSDRLEHRKNTIETQQLVDSLNEAAFIAKRNSIDTAFQILAQASKMAQAINYEKGLATNYFYEAGIYNQFGYSKRAITLYYKSLHLSTEANDIFNIARVNQQLANIFLESDNFDEAEKLFRDAMDSYTSLGRLDDKVNITNSIGLLKLKQNRLEEAAECFNKALTASKRNRYTYGLKKAYYHLALVALNKKQLPEAKTYFMSALDLDKQRGDKYGLALTEIKLAELELSAQKYSAAINWAESALQHAQLVSASDLEVEAIQNMLTVYNSINKLDEVIKWQNELIKIQSEVFKQEKNQALNFLELLKEKNEEHLLYEKQSIEAQQRAEVIYLVLSLLSIGLFLISILAYLWFKNYKKAKDFSLELSAKHDEIRKYAEKLANLNQTILIQNSALEENNVMKDTLFSIVSHDLRSPLGSVKGILSFIQRRVMTEAEIKEILSLLSNEVDIIMDMLNNLLEWSKAQLNGSIVNTEPVLIYELVEENIKVVANQARQKNIILENRLAEDSLATADKERLNFILRNLLVNAVKFTFDSGYITINGKEEGGEFILSVSDNGQGIAEDALRKLFDSEGRYTTIGTAKEKGTGLGLKLCKDFVQSIGGSIWVESKVLEGSTFYISLPKQEVPDFIQKVKV